MRRVFAVICSGIALAGGLAAEDFQGTLADRNCADRMVRDGRERVLQHDKACSLVRNPDRNSYALITDDNKLFELDDNGKRLAKELLNNSHDRDNLHVIARGQLDGKTIKVNTMSML